ncbi:hypothetical protein EJB05_54806, partial [Eragrostis curvula]
MKKAVVAMGGGGKGAAGTATTDLLVCFPARQRLALMPKPICSPSRATMDKAAAARRRSQMPGARSSPMFRGSKAKRTAEEDDEEEPRSPKVTCAGQIKVGRSKKTRGAAVTGKRSGKEGGSAKSWITVVEEIERMHGRRKKVGWLEAVWIKTDALPFLGGVMRSLRLKARCLGSLRGAVDSSTDDEDGDGDGERGSAPTSVFSKWLMVLEGGEEPSSEQDSGEDEERDREDDEPRSKEADECSNAPSAPPANALLLMRCRSAPAKGMSRIAAEPPPSEAEQEKGSAHAVAGDAGTEEDNRDDLVFMNSAPGFLKLSIDIAKETWLVGGGGDPLSRSRSWKR